MKEPTMSAKAKTPSSAEAVRRRAIEMGAVGAKIISPEKVFTAAWVRWKCRFGCSAFGSSRLCPPHSPPPAETRAVLDGYRRAILIHADGELDMRRTVAALEREAFLAGFYKAFGFACGPCGLCEECAGDKACRHAELARPAMEACGIDVFRTARAAGFPIEVVKDYKCRQNYYGLLLLE
jgi:predicted metal-binding protein